MSINRKTRNKPKNEWKWRFSKWRGLFLTSLDYFWKFKNLTQLRISQSFWTFFLSTSKLRIPCLLRNFIQIKDFKGCHSNLKLFKNFDAIVSLNEYCWFWQKFKMIIVSLKSHQTRSVLIFSFNIWKLSPTHFVSTITSPTSVWPKF